ncbi:uncharacterized protein BXIN_1680 [Babesia sp. Xinjiang]|uniref:uncharacterized protein n=1 Tax=Babesia sp. Xinjiang TaxID=462227 RepID=UPI000A241C5B|nr:uncharacterized protein BXIN_1739 [Babesia sp. Xinjiang]XP_028871426.1 uncharacterized protein BXIN_1680 [Babesia sp. Xinjiang]ORM40885.1 hypothetical protein BXIN_1739 [Babesia sp. Xinjiang]ORM40970.1 hypothetical protein BXIN_1680 [Babesia sp. Xinjiang]
MSRSAQNDRATSGYPDWYQRFYVHICDAECLFSGAVCMLLFAAVAVVCMKYLCDNFNYKTADIIRDLDREIRRGLRDFGRAIMKTHYGSLLIRRLRMGVSKYTKAAARYLPSLAPVFKDIAAYNTLVTWEYATAVITILLSYKCAMEVVRRIVQYLREREMLYYCVNMRPVAELNPEPYTRTMIERLHRSPEYLRLKQQRMHQGNEAWNWQTRQRMGERMPSDDMSDEEGH